ncbi:MAG: hypothetical protein WD007_01750, partial [Nitriliruptoraceae bacterium]
MTAPHDVAAVVEIDERASVTRGVSAEVGDIEWKQVPGYIVAQVSGAAVGLALAVWWYRTDKP